MIDAERESARPKRAIAGMGGMTWGVTLAGSVQRRHSEVLASAGHVMADASARSATYPTGPTGYKGSLQRVAYPQVSLSLTILDQRGWILQCA